MRKYYRSDNRRKFYAARLAAQAGKCAICERKDRLVIDHNHTTGMMRGLLCYKHNTALGLFNDDPITLRAAADYIQNNDPEKYEEIKVATEEYEKLKLSNELIPQLISDESFPSDRARARILAEKLGCPLATAVTRIRRARKRA